MAAKKNTGKTVGGALLFVGSLIYLYVLFTWYTGGAVLGPWVTAASFLGPFVVVVSIISAITLFFMGIGYLANKSGDAKMSNILWKFVMVAGVTTLIVTGGSAGSSTWFYVSLVAFLLSYIGAMAASM